MLQNNNQQQDLSQNKRFIISKETRRKNNIRHKNLFMQKINSYGHEISQLHHEYTVISLCKNQHKLHKKRQI